MQKQKKNTGRTNIAKYIFIGIILAIAVYFIYINFSEEEKPSENKTIIVDPKERIKNVKEPMFKKEGELEFYRKKEKAPLKKIDIELADNDNERTQGLMYRKSMDDEKGMLFIFQQEEPQSFWMKNTIIPLDIMYINSKKEIVKIFKNTTPFSERSLPSEKPAVYVLEVRGGFTDTYEVKEGDMIKFNKQ